VVKVRGAAHPVLVAARSESGASRRLRHGGSAFAFEQLQDAVRVLPDRADVAEHQLGRSVLRHPVEQPPEIEAAGTRCKALSEQRRACDGRAAYQQLLRSGALCNVLPVYVDDLTATP
jgi:hypothetical protein